MLPKAEMHSHYHPHIIRYLARRGGIDSISGVDFYEQCWCLAQISEEATQESAAEVTQERKTGTEETIVSAAAAARSIAANR